ncbi:hypothetical protein EDC01DRAFT_654389, partial [Geopyxis carbonaria]
MSTAPHSRLTALTSHLTASPTMTTPAKKPPVTCHVLNTVTGKPAAGIVCQLSTTITTSTMTASTSVTGTTNADGRVTSWNSEGLALDPGAVYTLRFETGAYWAAKDMETFFPYVEVAFKVKEGEGHYHVPLLLAPWSYSTYRGS